MTRPIASIETVSTLAGVSKATVSRVMNGITNKVSAETRTRVLHAVESLGYRPSHAGSALRQGRSHLVGLLVPDPGNAYNASIAGAVEQALRPLGKVIVLGNTREDARVQDDLLREMRSLLVGGIVMLGAVKSPELEDCLRARIPVVFVNRRSPVGLAGPYVGIDNAQAGREIGAYFADRGFRDVAVLHGPLTSSATRGRVGGFRSAFLKRTGSRGRVRPFLASVDRKLSGYLLAGELLAAGAAPQAIFCTTDEIAYGAAKRCHERGLRVPEDITLFGFDGNPLNEYLAPWLSTISVPYEEFGPAAADILRALWNKEAPSPPGDVILPFRTVFAQPT